MKKSIVLLLLILGFSSAQAKKNLDWANHAYTNVVLIKREGDLLGWRVQIIHSNLQSYILVQSFEGEPMSPCLMAVEIKKNLISAKFPADCLYRGIISGRIFKEEMRIEFAEAFDGLVKEKATLFLIK